MKPNCPDCDRCPWEIDPYDSDRRVCIKCGREYSFRRTSIGTSLILVCTVLFIVAILQTEPEHRPIEQQQFSSQLR